MVELKVGHDVGFRGIVSFPEVGYAIVELVHVPVQAVITDIKLAPHEPLMLGFLEILHQHLIPPLVPVKLLRQFSSEALGVIY